MPKFTLQCIYEAEGPFSERVNTVTFTEEGLYEVLGELQDFLRGCGYYFDGELMIVNTEEQSRSSMDDHSLDDFIKDCWGRDSYC